MGNTGWLAICAAEDLPAGSAREFAVNGAPGFVLRLQSQLVAYENRCPHQSLALNWRPNDFLSADRQYIICANHGAAFDWYSGHCLAGPCSGEHLRRWEVREHCGQVEVAQSPG